MEGVIDAGALRHAIIFQAPIRTRDVEGGYALTWANVFTLKCSIEQFPSPDGREYQFAASTVAEATHQITTRAQVATIIPTMRLVFGARVFNIVSTVVVNETRHILRILAKENIGVTGASGSVEAVYDSSGALVIDSTTDLVTV